MQLIENIKKDLFNKKYANPTESKNIILSKETRKNSNNSDLIAFLNVKENEIIEKIIEPNLKQLDDNYIIVTNNFEKYQKQINFMKEQGYNIEFLDLISENSAYYNPLLFLDLYKTKSDFYYDVFNISYPYIENQCKKQNIQKNELQLHFEKYIEFIIEYFKKNNLELTFKNILKFLDKKDIDLKKISENIIEEKYLNPIIGLISIFAFIKNINQNNENLFLEAINKKTIFFIKYTETYNNLKCIMTLFFKHLYLYIKSNQNNFHTQIYFDQINIFNINERFLDYINRITWQTKNINVILINNIEMIKTKEIFFTANISIIMNNSNNEISYIDKTINNNECLIIDNHDPDICFLTQKYF